MIPTHPFGRTGHMSTRTIFGAAAFSRVTQEEADHILDVLLHFGINHIDTAASYGDSEMRIGPWMDRHRDRFFLATKTGERTYDKAREQIRRSLERLRVSQIDLIQLHGLTDPAECETALGPGGALQAAIEARDEGLVRFIGVTGHGPLGAWPARYLLEHDWRYPRPAQGVRRGSPLRDRALGRGDAGVCRTAQDGDAVSGLSRSARLVAERVLSPPRPAASGRR